MTSEKRREPSVTAQRFAVLIPTYNRSSFLRRTLAAHCALVEAEGEGRVEIVVSDNASSDGTAAVVEAAAQRFPFVSLVRQPRHYDTGEEHIHQACRSVDHDFVWMFGDDDLPRPGSLQRMLGLAESGRYDFVVCNMRSFLTASLSIHPGRNAQAGLVGDDLDREGSVAELVAALGFQSVAACVSAVAFNRRKFAEAPFYDYFETAPIYSHVAAYLDAFKDSPCLYVGAPLLDYRTGATLMSNWRQLALRRGATLYWPWTTGVIRLFRLLRERGRIPPDLLSRVKEHTPDNIYSLWGHVVGTLVGMVDRALIAGHADQLPDSDTVEEICAELAYCGADRSVVLESAERLRRVAEVARALLSPHEPPRDRPPSDTEAAGEASLGALIAGMGPSAAAPVIAIVRDWAQSELAAVRQACSTAGLPRREDPGGKRMRGRRAWAPRGFRHQECV